MPTFLSITFIIICKKQIIVYKWKPNYNDNNDLFSVNNHYICVLKGFFVSPADGYYGNGRQMNKTANFSKNFYQILEISLKTHLLNIFQLDVPTSVKVKVRDYPENAPLNNYLYKFFRPHNIPPHKSKCRIQWSYYTVH